MRVTDGCAGNLLSPSVHPCMRLCARIMIPSQKKIPPRGRTTGLIGFPLFPLLLRIARKENLLLLGIKPVCFFFYLELHWFNFKISITIPSLSFPLSQFQLVLASSKKEGLYISTLIAWCLFRSRRIFQFSRGADETKAGVTVTTDK